MARFVSDLSSRVLAIAVVIAVLLGVLVWLLSGLGSPAEPVASAPGLEEPDGAEVAGPPPEAAPEGLEVEPGAEPRGETTVIELYLADADSRELVPRLRRITAAPTLAARAQAALQALINAGEPGYSSPLPPEAVVREVWVSETAGIAYVDLASNFPSLLGGGSTAEIHAVYGIVGTLTSSFPQIQAVQILVGGRPVDTLNGHLDTSLPLGPLRDWLH